MAAEQADGDDDRGCSDDPDHADARSAPTGRLDPARLGRRALARSGLPVGRPLARGHPIGWPGDRTGRHPGRCPWRQSIGGEASARRLPVRGRPAPTNRERGTVFAMAGATKSARAAADSGVSALDRFRAELPGEVAEIAAAVAADTEEEPDQVIDAVEHVIGMLGARAGWDNARVELERVGDVAARAGLPRPKLLDRYLTTGWVIWDVPRPSVDGSRRAARPRAGSSFVVRTSAPLRSRMPTSRSIESSRLATPRRVDRSSRSFSARHRRIPPRPADCGVSRPATASTLMSTSSSSRSRRPIGISRTPPRISPPS